MLGLFPLFKREIILVIYSEEFASREACWDKGYPLYKLQACDDLVFTNPTGQFSKVVDKDVKRLVMNYFQYSVLYRNYLMVQQFRYRFQGVNTK